MRKFNTWIWHIKPKYWRKRTGVVSSLFAIISLCLFVSCGDGSDNVKRDLSEAKTIAYSGDYDGAQKVLIELRQRIDDATPTEEKESFENLQGQIYYKLNAKDKAKESWRRALEYAKVMRDTSLILQNTFNLGLCETDYAKGVEIYKYAVRVSENREPLMYPQALEKLAQVYIQGEEYEKAGDCLDMAYKVSVASNYDVALQQIAFTKCEVWQAQDSLDLALAGFKSIPADSCSLDGKLIRANSIYSILYQRGDYIQAIEYLDSVHQFSDSIKSIDGIGRIEKIENEYNQKYVAQQNRYRILLISVIAVAVVVMTAFFFILKNMRLKRKQLDLMNQIAELNVKIEQIKCGDEEESESASNGNATATHEQIIPLLMEKFRLSKEIFLTSQEYATLKKLNLIRDLGADDKIEIKAVGDAIIGRFSDCCLNLRQSYPAMTNDDCLLCAIVYCGCGKEVQSSIMAASDEALRRRKSRIKQKLPENLFMFFFR